MPIPGQKNFKGMHPWGGSFTSPELKDALRAIEPDRTQWLAGRSGNNVGIGFKLA